MRTRTFKELFRDGGLGVVCEANLGRMKEIRERYGDAGALELLAGNDQRWKRIAEEREELRVMLEDIPEKWKQYHTRFEKKHRSTLHDFC